MPKPRNAYIVSSHALNKAALRGAQIIPLLGDPKQQDLRIRKGFYVKDSFKDSLVKDPM